MWNNYVNLAVMHWLGQFTSMSAPFNQIIHLLPAQIYSKAFLSWGCFGTFGSGIATQHPTHVKVLSRVCSAASWPFSLPELPTISGHFNRAPSPIWHSPILNISGYRQRTVRLYIYGAPSLAIMPLCFLDSPLAFSSFRG